MLRSLRLVLVALLVVSSTGCYYYRGEPRYGHHHGYRHY